MEFYSIIITSWHCMKIDPHAIHTQKAKKLICQCAKISDEPVVLLDLSLTIHTLYVEKKPLLSLLSIESSTGSEEGSRDQQMMPKLLNEAFSA